MINTYTGRRLGNFDNISESNKYYKNVTHIYLVRHGKSEAYEGKASTYARDIPLSREGQDQAIQIAEKTLLTQPPDLIISSPYKRARETSNPIKESFPNLNYEIWPEVQEFNYLSLIDGLHSTLSDRRSFVEEYWDHLCDPFWHYKCDECESFVKFISRVEESIYRLNKTIEKLHKQQLEMNAYPKLKTIYIFTHEQYIRAFQGILDGSLKNCRNPEDMKQFRQRLLSYSVPFGGILKVRVENTLQIQDGSQASNLTIMEMWKPLSL